MGAKRFRHEEESNHDRWLVSYADFITLLFAFFAVLYATSEHDLAKQKKFEDSIKKAFLAVAQFGRGSGPGDHLDSGEDTSVIPPPIEVFRRPKASPGELANAIERAVDEKLGESEQKALGLKIDEDEYGARVSLDASALFDSGSASLKPEIMSGLSKISEVLKDTKRLMIVEGHTDNLPIQSQVYPSNWELAAARATTVVRYLIRRHGVTPEKLIPVSRGDQKPIGDNGTEAGRAKNRRIEFLLTTRAVGIE